MKIKLQDYSLISNEWIDKEIDRLTKVAKACIADNVNVNVYVHTIKCLENVKQQLIPSEETDETELADIRNKLGALKNLIQLIERGYIVPDDKLKEIVEQSIPICKESIEYLANGNFKQNKKPNE